MDKVQKIIIVLLIISVVLSVLSLTGSLICSNSLGIKKEFKAQGPGNNIQLIVEGNNLSENISGVK